jgi:hypothetical protein
MGRLQGTFLNRNFPDPFNQNTTARHQSSARGVCTLKVFNAVGQEVATVINQQKETGLYHVQFDGLGLAGGVYSYRFLFR